MDQFPQSSIDGASYQLIHSIWNETKNDPVARLDRLSHYDPEGLTGFCFGRAMAVHLKARAAGIHPDSIKKQFIVGDLKSSLTAPTEWRFHVTTLIKSDHGVWYAVDPIFNQLMDADQWVRHTRGLWDQWHFQDPNTFGEQSQVYVTDRHAIMPDIRNFVAPELETGANLIELSFEPNNKAGFELRNRTVANAYGLTTEASEKYFLSAVEGITADRFNFVGLNFEDGFSIHYNRYFGDLMGIVNPIPNPIRPVPMPIPTQPMSTMMSVDQDRAESALSISSGHMDFSRFSSNR